MIYHTYVHIHIFSLYLVPVQRFKNPWDSLMIGVCTLLSPLLLPPEKSVGVHMSEHQPCLPAQGGELFLPASPKSHAHLSLGTAQSSCRPTCAQTKPRALSLQMLGTTNSVQFMRRSEFSSYLPVLMIYKLREDASPVGVSFPTLKTGILA